MFSILFLIILFNLSFNLKEFEKYKNDFRDIIINRMLVCKHDFLSYLVRDIDTSDDPQKFFCGNYTININQFPISGEVGNKPWSGNYWPIKFGGLSVRYNSNKNNSMYLFDESTTNVIKRLTWQESINKYHQPEEHDKYFHSKYYEKYIDDNYSPSEKYDLLIGDYNFTLTNLMKNEGYYVEKDKKGDVPLWMGLCHGWSPASIFENEPKHFVTLESIDGIKINFLPDDIKGLVSLLWSEAKYNTRFIGNRCKYKDKNYIPSDNSTGLWEDYSCFGINPASFIITFVNQIVLKNKNLIFDPDTRGEIWNQPVLSYKIQYFNLRNNQMGDLSSSIIYLEDKDNSGFLDYLRRKRSTDSLKFIGVHMTVFYLMENEPQHIKIINENYSMNVKHTIYKFALELDNLNNIVGGEWLSNFHPIFIWIPDESSKINGVYDNIEYDGSVYNLKKISKYAKIASNSGTVLGSIVKYLINKSTIN